MKKLKIKFIINLLITSYLLLVTGGIVNAAGLVPCGECTARDANGVCTAVNQCTICHLFQGTATLINYLTFYIASPVALIIMLYAGIMLLTSGESEERRTKGKKALWQAVWGLIIVFAAWLIVNAILGNLINTGYIPVWDRFPGC